MEQRTPEWEDARKGKMTCSRMAEAVGLIGSRRRLWRELTGRERLALAEYEQIVGPRTENRDDGVVGFFVKPVGFVCHPQIDWIGGSPDGLCHSLFSTRVLGGVEVKCPVQQYGRVPDYYVPQMQGLMEIFDLPRWDFVVWTPDALAITRVFRSTDYWRQMYELLGEFWTYVEADVEPPVFKRGGKPKITARFHTHLIHKE